MQPICLPDCLFTGLNSDIKGVQKTTRLGEEVKDNTRSKSIFTFKLPKWLVIFLCSTHANYVNHRPLVMLWNIIILCCWKYNLTAVSLCKPILILISCTHQATSFLLWWNLRGDVWKWRDDTLWWYRWSLALWIDSWHCKALEGLKKTAGTFF